MSNLTEHKPVFIEDGHIYSSGLGRYTSVTTLIHSFEPYKDWDAIASKYADKHGNTAEHWKAVWKSKGDIACIEGTAEHKLREDSLNIGKFSYHKPTGDVIDIGPSPLYYKDLYKLPDGVYPELLVWNNEFMISGTADVVVIMTEADGTRTVFIEDYKTNNEIKDYNYISKKSGKKVVNSYLELPGMPYAYLLCDCSYWKYQIQLNLYAWMLSKFGFKPNGGNIIHVKDNDKRYPMKNLQTELDVIVPTWYLDQLNRPIIC